LKFNKLRINSPLMIIISVHVNFSSLIVVRLNDDLDSFDTAIIDFNEPNLT